jgi:hypothetical protein
MNEKDLLDRKIHLKWQYYTMLEAERIKVYNEILEMMQQRQDMEKADEKDKSN